MQNKSYSLISDLVYEKSQLTIEQTKLLVNITFAAYKYLVDTHRSCCKDLDAFCDKLNERLDRIYTVAKIGLEGTKGIYANKEIKLKTTILGDKNLLMLTYAHELTHCLSESKNNTGIINTAKPFKIIKRKFWHHYLNEMETDYISISYLRGDFKLIDRKFTYKFYVNHNSYIDVSLFYQGDVYPEFSIFANVINTILDDLVDTYLDDERNFKDYIQSSGFEYLRKYIGNLEKHYSKFVRKTRKIDGENLYMYKHFIGVYEAYKEIVFRYIKHEKNTSLQYEELIEHILRNPVFIDRDKSSLNEAFAIEVKELLKNREE